MESLDDDWYSGDFRGAEDTNTSTTKYWVSICCIILSLVCFFCILSSTSVGLYSYVSNEDSTKGNSDETAIRDYIKKLDVEEQAVIYKTVPRIRSTSFPSQCVQVIPVSAGIAGLSQCSSDVSNQYQNIVVNNTDTTIRNPTGTLCMTSTATRQTVPSTDPSVINLTPDNINGSHVVYKSCTANNPAQKWTVGSDKTIRQDNGAGKDMCWLAIPRDSVSSDINTWYCSDKSSPLSFETYTGH